MKIVLNPNEKIVVKFHGTEGKISVEYNDEPYPRIKVTSNYPDDRGRVGIIYEKDFDQHSKNKDDKKGDSNEINYKQKI